MTKARENSDYTGLAADIANASNLTTGTIPTARITTLASSKLSGDIPIANIPSGSVLQIAESNVLVTTGVQTGTGENIICSLTFTPKSASSKLIIEGRVGAQVYGNNNVASIEWTISIFEGSSSLSSGSLHDNYNAGNTFHTNAHQMYRTITEDSVNTNARTYHMQIRKQTTNGRLAFGDAYNSNSIKVTEIQP
jgi:hypothetical protein|tara:strand:+ start:18 stop:599 length:582 start_codon:yes stop_codon:yes gene_type:complete